MFARVNRFTGSPERLEEGITMFRERVVPEVEKLPGFDGAMFMADREHETVFAITFWRSENELLASKEPGKLLAEEAARTFGSKLETTQCEVMVSKLPALVA